MGWPTFAVHDTTLVQSTIRKCIRKLRGTRGFKRFLRDGQYTDLESKDQRFYEATELKVKLNRIGIDDHVTFLFIIEIR